MTKKLSRWKPALLFTLAGIFVLATLISLLALASVSGIGAGLIVLAAAQLTISPLAFVTITSIIGLGMSILTASFAVFIHREVEEEIARHEAAPKITHISPAVEMQQQRKQVYKPLLKKAVTNSIYGNFPVELQQDKQSDQDNSEQRRP